LSLFAQLWAEVFSDLAAAAASQFSLPLIRRRPRTNPEDPMRNVLIVAALIAMMVGPTVPIAAAPAAKNARAIALADCEGQARAKRFGNRTIQRRNFLKDCMIDRGFYGDIN
jgi:hypothetical protein